MRLVQLLARYAYEWRPEGSALSSGGVSTEYIDCRRALGRPEVLAVVAEAVGVARNDADAIGGVAMGGIPIAAAVSMRSGQFICPMPWFYVRDTRKGHGTCHIIEGAVKHGESVVLVDDVVTTGESVISAVHACRDFGLHVVQVIALVDREQSGLERIQRLNVPVTSITTLSKIRAHAQRTP